MRPRISIVGYGPGHPELITVRGQKRIDEADVVFATSNGVPVDPAFFASMRPGTEVHDASLLPVDEYFRLAIEAARAGRRVVRLQPGDPSLFGSLAKQVSRFESEGIEVEVVPGVPVAFAAACATATDLTIPGLSEAVVLTRMEGRIPVPPHQKLADLAEHRPTLALYLSTTLLAQLVRELGTRLPPETPILVAHRVGWPQERHVRGTLADIVEKVRAAGVFNDAVILVGDVFAEAAGREIAPDRFW